MNQTKSLSRLLMAPGIALAFVLGYLLARGSADDGNTREGPLYHSKPISEVGLGTDKETRVTWDDLGPWQETKKQVMKRWERSPAARFDYELRDETRNLLEKTPSKDLEPWMRELRSDPSRESDPEMPLELRKMILKELARRDAASLIRSLAEHSLKEDEECMEQALAFGIEKDPMAVIAWLDGDIPQEIRENFDYCLEDAFAQLAWKDPVEFEKHIAKLDEETRESILQDYAYRRGSTDERAGILERAARSPHCEAMVLWEGLLRREGSWDPCLAYTTLRDLNVTADDRATLDQDLVSSLMNTWGNEQTSGKDRAKVMQAWVERNPGSLVAENLKDPFSHWCEEDPKEATSWLADQPMSPRYDTFARLLVEKQVDKQMETHEKVAKLALCIGDPATRRTALRQLKDSWQTRDAEAAAEWEKNLPAEVRELLK